MAIDNVQGVRSDIGEMLSKIREISSKTTVFTAVKAAPQPGQNFGDILALAKNATSNVSELQSTTDSLKMAYVSGDPNVSMSQVVLASQKSKLAFEGLLAVRNKILEAYKEIMNMPI